MYKVMIVDDKEIVRRELKRLKIWGETSGFIICNEAANGQEALNFLMENSIDLVITDIRMPKIDGIELLRAIVEKKLCSCVVLISDYSEFSYAREGLVLGAFDYISKPVIENDLRNLMIRAREYLDNQKQEKERVKKLEELHSEINEQNISLLDVGKLWELIMSRDQNTLTYAERMIDQIVVNKVDSNTVENIFTKSMQELTKNMFLSYSWIEKFIDSTELQNFRLPPNQDIEALKRLFLDKIKDLICLLNRLRGNTQEKGIVGQVCNYVLEHVENDISLAMAADTLFMNKTYISETFKQKTGKPFTEYVTEVKMERAKLLVLQGNLKSYEIAEKLGFKDTEYFSKVFKKTTGLTPTEFRKNRQEVKI